MPQTETDYQRYLNPKMLAKISSLDLRARLIVEGLSSGTHRSPYQGISVEFAQHRQYVPGDDVRHVDWKVLARTDKVYLKQYQEETNLQLICVVDASESMGFGTVRAQDGESRIENQGSRMADRESRMEDRASKERKSANPLSSILYPQSSTPLWTKYDHATAIAASLSYLTIQQQDAVGLAVFDQSLNRFLKPSSSPGQWRSITRELQQTPQLKKTSTGKVLSQLAEKLHHRSVIVILSDLFDDLAELKKGLLHLRYKKHETIVLQILDPAEIHFPYDDVTLFTGLEESGRLLVEPRSLRDAYLQQLRILTESLQKMCRGMHIDFTRMNSEEPLDVSLSQFLATRSASMK
jgi:uncharacterized protein (DUF58 family)